MAGGIQRSKPSKVECLGWDCIGRAVMHTEVEKNVLNFQRDWKATVLLLHQTFFC